MESTKPIVPEVRAICMHTLAAHCFEILITKLEAGNGSKVSLPCYPNN